MFHKINRFDVKSNENDTTSFRIHEHLIQIMSNETTSVSICVYIYICASVDYVYTT